MRRGLLVEAAAGAVSRVIHGAGHIVAGLQIAFELAQAAGIGVFARRDSERCFETALQMERALAKSFAQAFKRDRLIEMLLDVAADLFDHIGLRIAAQQPRPAAQAGSKAGFLGLLWMRERT